ncbi:serine/threonine-protein kinase sty46-like isoform x1 [Anaeramoeba ignava]|uniref:non-specific serine/threonine protein kinase n=1 Tax=Anaeramoeba ignava TaxID=1746090 RepID=A0A9Q0LAD0_ANAIG|nr:serine/threonine-protein kinase sty46-like isoform x1 [Anaeramoeba ignava]
MEIIITDSKGVIEKYSGKRWLQNSLSYHPDTVENELENQTRRIIEILFLIGYHENEVSDKIKIHFKQTEIIKDLISLKKQFEKLLSRRSQHTDKQNVFEMIESRIKTIQSRINQAFYFYFTQEKQGRINIDPNNQIINEKQGFSQARSPNQSSFLAQDNFSFGITLNNGNDMNFGNQNQRRQDLLQFDALSFSPKDMGQSPQNILQNILQKQQPKQQTTSFSKLYSNWEIDPNDLKFNKLVGVGGFGKVYKGVWEGTEVAIKVLLPEKINDENIESFRQEVEVMGALRHPNIVLFMGAHMIKEPYCVITEFMEGGSLFDLIHKKKDIVLSSSQMKNILLGIARGMNYLHCSGMLHRDLKSLNVLLDLQYNVKICDFGMSRMKQDQNVMTGLIGSYYWMAPEILANIKYDEKIDVFSYAIVLYELVARKIPYDRLNPIQVAVGVLNEDLRPTLPDNVPKSLSDLIQACWDKNPVSRPSFKQIIQILNSGTILFPSYSPKGIAFEEAKK